MSDKDRSNKKADCWLEAVAELEEQSQAGQDYTEPGVRTDIVLQFIRSS